MGKGLQEFHFYDIDRRGCIRMQFYQVVETWRSMFATTYKTFNINNLSNQIVETQNFASLLLHWK